jgi:O-antigen ligase
VGTRTDIWRAAVTIWEQHPVLGVGVGGFPLAYAETPIPGKLFLPNTVFQPPPHAHNLFLNILAEQGIIGFVVFLLVVLIALRACVRLRAGPDRFMRMLGTGLLAALLAFLVHNLFDVTLFDSVTGPYVFVLLGLVAAADLMMRPAGMPAPAR